MHPDSLRRLSRYRPINHLLTYLRHAYYYYKVWIDHTEFRKMLTRYQPLLRGLSWVLLQNWRRRMEVEIAESLKNCRCKKTSRLKKEYISRRSKYVNYRPVIKYCVLHWVKPVDQCRIFADVRHVSHKSVDNESIAVKAILLSCTDCSGGSIATGAMPSLSVLAVFGLNATLIFSLIIIISTDQITSV